MPASVRSLRASRQSTSRLERERQKIYAVFLFGFLRLSALNRACLHLLGVRAWPRLGPGADGGTAGESGGRWCQCHSHSRGHSLDGLTGVPERKSFDDEVQRWMTRFKTDQAPFVCGMIDLDDFKKVNDTYGHQTGDFVLKEAAAFLKANIGPTDFIARYGGEEFVILLASLNLRQAAEKIAEPSVGRARMSRA